MRYLPDGAWMQKADAYTIQEIGIPSEVLMERAALKVTEYLTGKNMDLSRVLVVCGSGNNGGDGFAVARLLFQKGVDVTAAFAGKEDSMSRECRMQAEIAARLGVPIVTDLPEDEYSMVIDAVFGVGLSREVSGRYADVIRKMNEKKGRKLAIDIPSGIDARTGQVLGIAFVADDTVSFQCQKLGTALFPGAEYAGQVNVADIGIELSVYQKNPDICYTLEPNDLSRLLPERKDDSHKGSYGKVLMITGSEGMAGAAYLSAKAAYLCGAGLVRIYTDETNRTILQQLLPEAIISVYKTGSEEEIDEMLEWADVVCIGCGLGRSEQAKKLLEYTLENCEVPCVADADGLNLLAENLSILTRTKAPLVLTPHMKEMAGLLGGTVVELKSCRMSKLREFTKCYPVVCVQKDSRTFVSMADRPVFVNTAGNQAMAKAGSGDVLAGTVTGLLAQGMPPYEASALGVYLHACGGDEAKRMCGSYSVLAEDLLQGMKTCMKRVDEGRRTAGVRSDL